MTTEFKEKLVQIYIKDGYNYEEAYRMLFFAEITFDNEFIYLTYLNGVKEKFKLESF